MGFWWHVLVSSQQMAFEAGYLEYWTRLTGAGYGVERCWLLCVGDTEAWESLRLRS